MKTLNVDESSAVLYSLIFENNMATPEWVSDNVTEISGYPPALILQPNWWSQQIHPDDQQVETDVNQQLVHQGYITYEYRFMFADGEYRWLRDEMRIIHDSELGLIRILGVWRDITEERHKNALLVAQEERLRFVLEATGDGFWDWYTNSDKVLWAERNWTLLGMQPPSDGFITHEQWSTLIHPDDLDRVVTEISKILNNETETYNSEYRLRHKNGSWVWISVRGQVIEYDANNMPLRLLGLHTDISARKAAEKALLEHQRMLNQLTRQVPGMLYQYVREADDSVHMPYASEKIEQLYHVTAKDVQDNILKLTEQIHPDDLTELQQTITDSATGLTPWRHLFRTLDKNGQVNWIKGEANPEQQSDGSIIWYGYHTDITAEKKAEQDQRLAANVFQHTHEGIMITDANKVIIEVNPTFSHITGYARSEAIGQHASFGASGEHCQAFYDEMEHCLKTHGFWQGEVWNKKKNGTIYCERKTISAVYNDTGDVFQYVGLFNDITQLKQQQKKLEQLAHYDHLTHLPNRSLLNDRLNIAITTARRSYSKLTLVYIDLDDFKPINDHFGHSSGDTVLKVIANRLLTTVRASDTVARLGGDEFIVLLNNESVSGYQILLKRLLKVVMEPIAFAENEVVLSASFGVAHFPSDADSPEALIQHADKAMYQAKRKGKNQIAEFSEIESQIAY